MVEFISGILLFCNFFGLIWYWMLFIFVKIVWRRDMLLFYELDWFDLLDCLGLGFVLGMVLYMVFGMVYFIVFDMVYLVL